jgi:hypothetical protein
VTIPRRNQPDPTDAPAAPAAADDWGSPDDRPALRLVLDDDNDDGSGEDFDDLGPIPTASPVDRPASGNRQGAASGLERRAADGVTSRRVPRSRRPRGPGAAGPSR